MSSFVSVVEPSLAPSPEQLVERLRADLDRRVEDLSDAAWRARKRSDAAAIHDLRVASRRLAAALAAWQGTLESRPRLRARSALRTMRRALGPARELEVNLEILGKRARKEQGPVRAALRSLLRELRGKLRRRRREGARAASGPRIGRIVGWVEESAARLEDSAERLTGEVDEVRSRIAARRQTAERALVEALLQESDGALHQARIAVKKWRYALECRAAVDARVDDSELKLLRALQRSLGAIHDRAVLGELLDRRAKSPRKKLSRKKPSPKKPSPKQADEPAQLWRRLSRSLQKGRRRELKELRSLVRPLVAPSPPGPRLASA